jgi:hypothetical protein
MTTPRHIHLALGYDHSHLHLSWASDANLSQCSTRVWFGLSAESLDHFVMPTCSTYTIGDMCESPAKLASHFTSPDTLHDAVIPLDLLLGRTTAATSVWYQIEGAPVVQKFRVLGSSPSSYGANGWNGEYPYSFISFGDLGVAKYYPNAGLTMSRTRAIINDTASPPINYVLLVGDVAYSGGNQSKYFEFMKQIEPIAKEVPFMVGPGNHDTLCTGNDMSFCTFNPPWYLYLNSGGSGGDCGVPYDKLFFMPGVNGTRNNRWYSFDHGPVHMVIISSEEDMRVGSPQHKWLSADLALTRARTPDAWLIVSFHRPVYGSTVIEFAPERRPIRAALEPLFLEHSVDM